MDKIPVDLSEIRSADVKGLQKIFRQMSHTFASRPAPSRFAHDVAELLEEELNLRDLFGGRAVGTYYLTVATMDQMTVIETETIYEFLDDMAADFKRNKPAVADMLNGICECFKVS